MIDKITQIEWFFICYYKVIICYYKVKKNGKKSNDDVHITWPWGEDFDMLNIEIIYKKMIKISIIGG